MIEVWASEDNVRGNADIVATVRANHYFDQQSGAINKYYWIRARNKFGQVSNYTPDLTTTTVVGVAALPISLPDYAVKFNYDDLDTSGRAAGKSRYAMLTDRDVNTSGSRDNFQNTDGILINKTDFDSAVHDGFFGTLRLAERIAFVVSPTRWYLFTIDEIMGVVGTGAAMAYKVGVTYIFSRDADPGVNIPTRSRTPVTFEFQRSEFSDIIAIADPDFDLSTGSVGAFVSGTYWLEITADDGRIDWRPGDGDDGSNAIDIYTAGGDTGDKAFVESRPMIKASAETWQFIVKYKTVTQTASGVMFAKFVAAGWANPLDENPTAPVQSGQITAQLPESFNTWTIVRVVVPTDGLDTARYWSFRLGYQQGFLDFEKYRFDSIYVSAVPKAFGDVLQNTVVSGLVPESNTSTDAGKVLRADGSWVVQGGAAADILVGTASSGNNLIGTKGTVVSVGWDASVEDTDEITGFDDGESDIVITNAGELLLDASVAVIDAGVNNRTTLALRVRLRNSSNVEQYLYYVDSTYIRDDANTYDSGLMAVQLELHVAAGDKLQIQSEVLDAQTTSGTMNASTTYSKLRLQKIS